MIPFLMLIAVITGYTLSVSPFLGLFFMSFLMVLSWRKTDYKWLAIVFAAVSSVTFWSVGVRTAEQPPPVIEEFTVTDYKYYQDDLQYIVTYEGDTYDMFLETSQTLPIGHRCTGPFSVSYPDAERNFIKKDDRLRLLMNDTVARIYITEGDITGCRASEMTLPMQLNQIRYDYMMKVLESTPHDFKYDILTLSVGNKSYIESHFFDALQKLGIYHLYVISGTHVAFITGVLFFFFKRLRLTIMTIKWLLIVSLLAFLCLNFFSPSVFRAVFMAVLLLITSMFRKKPYLSIISLSALLQIVLNPYIVFHAGFQLSYITTYFILLSRVFIKDLHPAWQLAVITIIAEVSTLAVIIHQFNEISISGIIMNMIFVPLFSAVIFPGVILYNVCVLFEAAFLMDGVYQFVFSNLKTFILYLSEGIRHRIPIKTPPVALFTALIVLTLQMARHTLSFNYVKLTACASLFACILIVNQSFNTDDYTVTMIDVSQGDAFLIEDHSAGKAIMVDTGGRFYHEDPLIRLSDKTVLPYLKERGIAGVDLMILSHMDLDHTGEAAHILSNVGVSRIMTNFNDPKFAEWHDDIIHGGYTGEMIDGQSVDSMTVGGMHIEMLPMTSDHGDDSNAHSLVFKIVLGDYSFLMTGDMTEQMEHQLLERGADVSSDYLKLAHHGSETSSSEAFLDAVGFNGVLVSAGVDNRFGHPAEEVMARLHADDVYSTKEHGMVRFKIKGDKMCIETRLDEGLNKCIKKS